MLHHHRPAAPRPQDARPTLLDAETKMLHECSLFASHAAAYLEDARRYAARAGGFVDAADAFLSGAGYPSAWRTAPTADSRAAAARVAVGATTASAARAEPAPIAIPEEHAALFTRAAQREAVGGARRELSAALQERLALPFEAWLDAYGAAKDALPHVERLRRAHDAARVRLEAARGAVQAEEAGAPLTAATAEAGPIGAGGDFGPLPAEALRAEMAKRASEAADAARAFEAAAGPLRVLLEWLVGAAARDEALVAHGTLHALSAAAEREVPVALLAPPPQEAAGVAAAPAGGA